MADSGKPPPSASGAGASGTGATTAFTRPPSVTTGMGRGAGGGVAIGMPAHKPFTTFGPTPPPQQHQFVSSPSSSSTPQMRPTMVGTFGSQLRPSSAPPPPSSSSSSPRLVQSPLRPTPPPPSSTFNSQRMPPPSSLTQHHMHSTIPSSPSSFRPPNPNFQNPNPNFHNPNPNFQRPIQTLQQQRPFQTPLPHLQMTPQNTNFQNPNPKRVPISGPIGPLALINSDTSENSDRIVTKRTIHELFSQIDTLEKVEEEVEDVLIEVAEEFIESLTTFACCLAKHRKSPTLEAKDILLHAERNWNITLPGFTGDEIKMYKKQNVNDIHRERLALIKKTMGNPRRAYLSSQQTPQNKP